MESKKNFWSIVSVVFLAVLLPTILRQVNKISRSWAGAEGRLASINIDTHQTTGFTEVPFSVAVASSSVPLDTTKLDNSISNISISGQVPPVVTIDGSHLSPDEVFITSLRLAEAIGMNSLFRDTKFQISNLSDSSPAYDVAMGTSLLNSNLTGVWAPGVQNSPTAQNIDNLFAKLGPQKLMLSGEGSWVFATAAVKNKTYQVILSNYDPKNLHSEVVPVNFLNLPKGSFEFRKTFQGMATTTEKIATDASFIQKLIPMQPNSVAFLELELK